MKRKSLKRINKIQNNKTESLFRQFENKLTINNFCHQIRKCFHLYIRIINSAKKYYFLQVIWKKINENQLICMLKNVFRSFTNSVAFLYILK